MSVSDFYPAAEGKNDKTCSKVTQVKDVTTPEKASFEKNPLPTKEGRSYFAWEFFIFTNVLQEKLLSLTSMEYYARIFVSISTCISSSVFDIL